jgi:hypothetical protein
MVRQFIRILDKSYDLLRLPFIYFHGGQSRDPLQNIIEIIIH